MDRFAFDCERRLFEAALELQGQERRRFLQELAARDSKLASRLKALLAAHERPELSTSACAVPTLLRPPPRQVGPYRLLKRLGEGGMGVVYVAEQTEPVRRRVALKLIKGVSYSRELVGRFHSERQALALMNHPNIARILDAGSTDDGLPFFVMEYVRGASLLDHCDRRRLSIDDRLELFIQVCEAVQHAHQQGVIHRDLKPSNILVAEVDGRATPKVIDFGVAKMLGPHLGEMTSHTGLGGFIGTPGYASPEQVRTNELTIDARSDVYSLGVVLYRLLTGLHPFDLRGVDLGEIRQRLAHDDPQPPSRRVLQGEGNLHNGAGRRLMDTDSLARRLRGDLDAITLKALAKDRSQRYAGVSELAADLRRHGAHEGVSARPPSTTPCLPSVRRNAVLLGVGTLAFCALVVGTLGASFGLQSCPLEERIHAHAAVADARTSTTQQAPYRSPFAETLQEVCDESAMGFKNSRKTTEGRIADELAQLGDSERALVVALAAAEATGRRNAEALAALARAYDALADLDPAAGVIEPNRSRLQHLLDSLPTGPPPTRDGHGGSHGDNDGAEHSAQGVAPPHGVSDP